jgi:hypothetical protein
MRASSSNRQGPTLTLSGAALTEQTEALAHEIAGPTEDAIVLEHACVAAEAELELARVRRVRLAMIDRVTALGGLKPARHFRSDYDEVRWLIAMDIWMMENKGRRPPWPTLKDPAATMPPLEPHRSSEAVRRLLPDLVRLDRYERRAAARRDRAIRQITRESGI